MFAVGSHLEATGARATRAKLLREALHRECLPFLPTPWFTNCESLFYCNCYVWMCKNPRRLLLCALSYTAAVTLSLVCLSLLHDVVSFSIGTSCPLIGLSLIEVVQWVWETQLQGVERRTKQPSCRSFFSLSPWGLLTTFCWHLLSALPPLPLLLCS